MKILLVHNYYQNPGGEDEVFAAEADLLERAGHQVCRYTRTNEEISRYGLRERVSLPLRTVWAWDSLDRMRALLKSEKPRVVHFHNTFPLISPSAYLACQEAGAPVVQYLHNPRLMCPAATLYRDGRVCEDCLGRVVPWPSLLHRCYHNSYLETGVVAGTITLHRILETWKQKVDVFIVFTDFYRRKFVDAGIPPEKIMVKPHFVAVDPGPSRSPRRYALFVGRLAAEKGVTTLLEAWRKVPSIDLKIRGEGPLIERVRERAADPKVQIELIPRLDRRQLDALFHGARFLIWPSEGFYETFGMVAAEAFACGLAVIASRIGVMEEIVREGSTGLLFNPGDPEDLAAKVRWACTHPDEMEAMGRNARVEYESKYTPEGNYGKFRELWGRLGIHVDSFAETSLASRLMSQGKDAST